jgi:N-acetylneuraminate synthase
MEYSFQSWFENQSGCIIIGEIGVNHNGSLELAKKLIDVAVDAGADSVKFQTFTAEKLATRTAAKAKYQVENEGQGGSQIDMLRKLELSRDDLMACKAYCDQVGMIFLSTPFDEEAADLLEDIGVGGFKISSGDLTNLPLLAHIAQKGRPMIISTGMANMAEVEEAVTTIRDNGNPALAILHCVSNYPADPSEANLRAMDTLGAAFNVPVGWSDHTLGDTISVAAIARGAKFLEKHYTLDVNLPGPDHKASLDPDEFKTLVKNIRTVESALGDGVKRPQPSETSTADVARRSLVAGRDIKSGETISEADIICKRPGTGLKPNMMPYVVGRSAKRDIDADTLLSLDDLQ